ncbi:MAG: KH domain-containing protein [bacterium]
MKDILEFIIKNITTNPNDVIVTEEEVEGITNFTIAVNPEDVGRIIGKEGKIIKSIRAIMRVIAIQRGVRIRVSVISENSEPANEVATEVEEAMPVADESLTVEI